MGGGGGESVSREAVWRVHAHVRVSQCTCARRRVSVCVSERGSLCVWCECVRVCVRGVCSPRQCVCVCVCVCVCACVSVCEREKEREMSNEHTCGG